MAGGEAGERGAPPEGAAKRGRAGAAGSAGAAEAPRVAHGEPILEARGISKRFGRRVAVDDLTFTVRAGDVFGFLGPNGAGKTTTIRMLLRLIRRDAGQVHLFGLDLDQHPLEVLAGIGALVEEPAFYPYLTGRKNLEVFGRLARGGVTRARVDEVLAAVGLAERGGDKVTAYSQGMRQRLGIAQALLTRPRLLFLDEPTNGLDPPGIEEMRGLLKRLAREEDVTIVLSSHLLHEVEMLCDRVLIIDRGRLVVEGAVDALLETDTVRLEMGVEPLEAAHAAAERLGLEVEGTGGGPDRIVLSCPRERVAELNEALIAAGARVHALIPRRPTLEEYFRKRVQGGGAGAGGLDGRPGGAAASAEVAR